MSPTTPDTDPLAPGDRDAMKARIDAALGDAHLTTHRAVAEATGIGIDTLRRRKRRIDKLRIDELAAISEATGVAVVELAGGQST